MIELEGVEGMGLFGKMVSAFLEAQFNFKPQQGVGTPQGPVSDGVSVEPPAPTFDDPQDALRWKLVHSTSVAVTEMMDKYSQCCETAEKVDRAFAMASAEFVDGVRQHELSKANFHKYGVEWERELEGLLGGLREATVAARNQWQDLLFLLPGSENDVMRIMNWCMSHGVDSDVSSSLLGQSMLLHTDFGLTRDSFLTENERVERVLASAQQQSGQ